MSALPLPGSLSTRCWLWTVFYASLKIEKQLQSTHVTGHNWTSLWFLTKQQLPRLKSGANVSHTVYFAPQEKNTYQTEEICWFNLNRFKHFKPHLFFLTRWYSIFFIFVILALSLCMKIFFFSCEVVVKVVTEGNPILCLKSWRDSTEFRTVVRTNSTMPVCYFKALIGLVLCFLYFIFAN